MNIDDMEYGYCFHVYLRKFSDTDWSVVLWNMVNCISKLDADEAKKDRVWSKFAQWCDKHWHDNPDMPFYDVALAWTKLEDDPLACPTTSAGFMFRKTIRMVDDETRNDLNESARYDLSGE